MKRIPLQPLAAMNSVPRLLAALLAVVLLAALSACASSSATSSATPPEKPNVVFVLADEWRAQAFGFAGDPNVHTPHFDALHNESVACTHLVSTVPVCSPMRASFLTGESALTHGVFINDEPLNPKSETIAKVFARAGYDTGYIGKWHVNGDGRSAFIPRDRRQGFEYWKALECTHNYNHSFYYADGPEKLLWKGYDAIAQTADAQQYLRSRAHDGKPFFLVLSWGPPHDPYQTAPQRYKDLYKPADIQLRPNVPADMQAKARAAAAGYYAHCSALDDCMGQLLQTLQESGLAKNTIVVFTSDHGDLLGSHDAFFKQQPYDESIRVPFLLRWPEQFGTQPRSLDALMNTEDLMPTLLGLCRLPIPKTVEGRDYSGYLRGGKSPSDGAALISCITPFGQWDRQKGGKEFRGIRTARYTFVRDLNGPWLLFDDQADPYQLHNLANDPAHAALQAELDAMLMRKLKETGDTFRPGDEYIKQWGYVVNENGTAPYTP